MGLFQKQPITHTRTFYELESDKTLLIAGLGNPGKKYAGTRHNAGFIAIDSFVASQEFPDWASKKSLYCELTSKLLGSTKVILAKPSTYMNDSGKAIQALQNFYKIKNNQTLVIADELDINFGQIRTRHSGSSAGHNGVQSVIDVCGEDFNRLRIGIGPKQPEQIDSADYVLHKFSKYQEENLEKLRRETNSLIGEYIYSGGQIQPETRSFILPPDA
jgi:PTH1 family peptidyl-tRNA hydrolase